MHNVFRHITHFSSSVKPVEYKVALDNQTLYIGKELAKALGWDGGLGAGRIELSLHGLDPTFFTITPTGSESGVYHIASQVGKQSADLVKPMYSETLARNTVESGLNKNVVKTLEYLKDRWISRECVGYTGPDV